MLKLHFQKRLLIIICKPFTSVIDLLTEIIIIIFYFDSKFDEMIADPVWLYPGVRGGVRRERHGPVAGACGVLRRRAGARAGRHARRARHLHRRGRLAHSHPYRLLHSRWQP